jgi:lysozyme
MQNVILAAKSLAILALVGLFLPSPVAAEEQDLVDDLSRGDLLRYALTLDPGVRVVPDRFRFPTDAAARPEWVFGTDVSHHDGVVDWTKARRQQISYAYVKATQGIDFNDGMFKKNWEDLGRLSSDAQTRVYRGAYHFLSAQSDAKRQAEHFLTKIGTLSDGDLPPTVDLEWDAPAGSDPGQADRWKNLSSVEIIAKVKTWLDTVEQVTGKRSMIYTAASWWRERIGSSNALNGYKIWIADYSRNSQLQEMPKVPTGYSFHLWQFSERGKVDDGFTTNVDVNVFKGSASEFDSAFGWSH